VADTYRWLEDISSAEVEDWLLAQDALAASYLTNLPSATAFARRLRSIYNVPRTSAGLKAGGFYFSVQNDGSGDQHSLWVRRGLGGTKHRLVDPAANWSIASFVPSPSGEWVAYAVSKSGSDWLTWRIVSAVTREHLADEVKETRFADVAWLPDSSGFFTPATLSTISTARMRRPYGYTN
jgi:prolyl oligopeptidase